MVSLTGMVFTGGIRPRQRDLDALREAGLFAYLMDAETYEVASQVHGLLVKTHPANRAKIEEIKRLVTDHFDVDGLLERLDGLTRDADWSPEGAPTSPHAPGGSRSSLGPMSRLAGWSGRASRTLRRR
jgi:hypothetical protein